MANIQLQRLLDSVENHGVRLSRNWTEKNEALGGKVSGYSVVTTSPGERASPFLTVIIVEYEDGGYDLYTPSQTNKITADVELLCGLGEGEGTLVD